MSGYETITFSELTSRAPSHVDRWHNRVTLQRENIAEHQWYVGYQAYILTWLLAEREWDVVPDVALLFGMLHDMAEIVTGDLPSPFKSKHPGVNDTWSVWEDEVVGQMFQGASEGLASGLRAATRMAADEDRPWTVERSIVIFCDKLSALAFNQAEIKLGSRYAADNAHKYWNGCWDYGRKQDWWDAICEAVPDLKHNRNADRRLAGIGNVKRLS